MEFIEFKQWLNKLIDSACPEDKELLRQMGELYMHKQYPLDIMLHNDSLLDGIIEGGTVIETRYEVPAEHRHYASCLELTPKTFSLITVSHPKYLRECNISIAVPFELDTIVKWEYPSAVKAETKRLHELVTNY
jgi:hypothetical protein